VAVFRGTIVGTTDVGVKAAAVPFVGVGTPIAYVLAVQLVVGVTLLIRGGSCANRGLHSFFYKEAYSYGEDGTYQQQSAECFG
jgi:hypothetical protein